MTQLGPQADSNFFDRLQLPNHWQVVPLKFALSRGQEGVKIGPFGSALRLETLTDTGLKVYGQENVIQADFGRGHRHVPLERASEFAQYLVRPGDLLVTMMGTAGRCEVVPQGAAVGILDSHLLRLRVDPGKLHPEFLRWFLNDSAWAKVQLDLMGGGSIMHGLNSSIVKNVSIGLPPMEEQGRIAAFLDHETARIDELVREQERLQSLLAEKRDEVIGRAVREGLDGEESIPIGDVFIRSAPKSWQVSPLRRFLKHVSPRAVGEAWRDYTLLSLTRQGIIERDIDSGIGKFPAEFNGYQRVEPGQVVFCLFDIDETPRTVGYSDKRGMITSAYAVFEPTEYGNGEFISYYFQYVDTYKGLRPFYSGLRKTIRPNNFLGVRVAIPEVSEQERIVRFLDAELEKLDRLAEVAQRNIDLLLERRSALISAAVTGHLDLRDWQPSAPERVAEVA